MSKKVETQWFVEPLDANTNEVIVRFLINQCEVYENYSLRDNKGVARTVLQLEKYSYVSRLYNDKFKFSLKFKIYTRQGSHSSLRPWLFDESKHKKKPNFR